MLKILTSLSFLYAFSILVLLVYGFVYYRNFMRSGYHRSKFPFVFAIIGIACFSFLWINIHAPLQLKTFSNLDHHFLQHDGFAVNGSIVLGRSDTVNSNLSTTNNFSFSKKNGTVLVNSAYSEDPFYISGKNGFKIASVTYPATGHSISFQCKGLTVHIQAVTDKSFELKIGETVFTKELTIKKGSPLWNIFRDEDAFISSPFYNNQQLASCLSNILVIKDDVTRRSSGELKFFLSGRLYQYADVVLYDQQKLQQGSQQFNTAIPDGSTFAWGIGFLDNNRNQFNIKYAGADSFYLLNRYPVGYPLIEENRADWTAHSVSKFLVSDAKQMQLIPSVFKEGFLFSSFSEDSAINFSPVLLTYQKAAKNDELAINARLLMNPAKVFEIKNEQLILPSQSRGFDWVFSVSNTYNWEFGSGVLAASKWQTLLFGSLAVFFLLVFFTSVIKPADKQSWVWQLLSCIVFVLLTTRFFLYWRYKSFPPYEGMDLPSQQQLQSFSNFGIILFATLVLSLIFGFSFLKYSYVAIRKKLARLFRKNYYESYHDEDQLTEKLTQQLGNKFSFVKSFSKKTWFFVTWTLVLLGCGAIAALNNFDPGVCRHIAIALILFYFFYLYQSYKHSPLVVSASQSWWGIGAGRPADMIVSNPVKILLSVSLLAVFVFVDIGFAIVFINFLLFNEAFLCSNYAIAGLSAGSKKNAALFGIAGLIYLVAFVLNILYAPYIFKYLLELPQLFYIVLYALFAVSIAFIVVRLLHTVPARKRMLTGLATTVVLFCVAFFFFPKERILDKAAMTKYRIDVLTVPVDKAIAAAYEEGKTYEPVIRAAQNQWFINTFIYEDNNPAVQSAGFNLLPHAPQNKGAKYNAQATDLVASRFLIAEQGKWSVLLYVLLLLLPTVMLASFYKLYPDFTNRINNNYPTITAGFSILNYFLITALLVILAATGRYIFFGQDLPFGSILSKQSILFPCILILAVVFLFRRIPLEYYANRKKIVPGTIVFLLLAILLFAVKPLFNKNKEFSVADLAKGMDGYIQLRLQPVMDHFDTSAATKRFSIARKDQLFTDSIRKMMAAGLLDDNNKFFVQEAAAYIRGNFSKHLDQRRMLYLDLYNGTPQLSVNDNYFRVEPPPHLQQLWKGNVFSDTTVYDIGIWNAQNGSVIKQRLSSFTVERVTALTNNLQLRFGAKLGENSYKYLYLVNTSSAAFTIKTNEAIIQLKANDSLKLSNPYRATITDNVSKEEQVLDIVPDAFMKNYYVNGSRFYVYPMGNKFNWVRNFAEAVSADYSGAGEITKNSVVSFDFELMDSLSGRIQSMVTGDSAYKKEAEYGICIADGNGRLVAMADFIKGMKRPDPNDKAAFAKMIRGENGIVAQSVLRKQIGNLNLLRLNPGPGSTLKPIVFSAIASQLNLDWDAFSTEGFTEKQHYFGGEKVPEYDFEKNNGTIGKVTDYLKYSDNYYHANVLLLGAYPKQSLQTMLSKYFVVNNPGTGLHWPYFNYKGKTYWMDGFKNWPGYLTGKANFGMDSSSATIGLLNNFGIYTRSADKSFDKFNTLYDSLLFMQAYRKSGFILPEYSLFDQYGENVDHRIPYDLFTSCFRGHVKGSSQVMMAPAKMVEAFGKMISQSKNYTLTLNPYAATNTFSPFSVDKDIPYNNYLSVIRENVFAGMREALFTGTAARLGGMLKNASPYFYYAKTGTTGDDESKSKSKLFVIIISEKDVTAPGFNFRNNKFYTIYFTSQNGPAKQNEEFQAAIINYVQQSKAFKKYMNDVSAK